MIDIQLLKAEFVKNGLTQRKVAEMLGISERTLSYKLKRGVFGSDEIEIMINKLKIRNPVQIFFSKKVSQ